MTPHDPDIARHSAPESPRVFPYSNESSHADGIMLRDWFAGQALNGFCVEDGNMLVGGSTPEGVVAARRKYWKGVADAAYIAADAMLAARSES